MKPKSGSDDFKQNDISELKRARQMIWVKGKRGDEGYGEGLMDAALQREGC